MIENIVKTLYTITVSLQVPVVGALILSMIWSLFEIGRFFREWVDRKISKKKWKKIILDLSSKECADADIVIKTMKNDAAPDLIKHYSPERIVVAEADFEIMFQEMELKALKRWSRMRLGIRIAPVLGLMGTLIPMGPALMNISLGNLSMMSENLIIAFGTTVAGLFVGGLCYIMLTVRQYWYVRDIAQAEHIVEIYNRCKNGK